MAQTYIIPSDSLFITTLSIIETYPWAWECSCIAHLYWNWCDAIGFVTLSLIQCIYVLKCRVIICLGNRFMNVRPQVPQHLPEQTQSFYHTLETSVNRWWNYEKRSLKTHIQVSFAKCQPFFFRSQCVKYSSGGWMWLRHSSFLHEGRFLLSVVGSFD